MRNFFIEYKIVAFGTLALSRLVYLVLLTVIPNHINDEVAKKQKNFIWNNSYPRIKHWAQRMDFKIGGQKMLIYVLNLSVFIALGLKKWWLFSWMEENSFTFTW